MVILGFLDFGVQIILDKISTQEEHPIDTILFVRAAMQNITKLTNDD